MLGRSVESPGAWGGRVRSKLIGKKGNASRSKRCKKERSGENKVKTRQEDEKCQREGKTIPSGDRRILPGGEVRRATKFILTRAEVSGCDHVSGRVGVGGRNDDKAVW